MAIVRTTIFKGRGYGGNSKLGAINISVRLPFSLVDFSKHEEMYLQQQLQEAVQIALIICFGEKALQKPPEQPETDLPLFSGRVVPGTLK